ncbi:MAG: hypothetical protein HQL51_04175 [Magnetococcales bacterium]|nr:hypothetical protein [Magnetococcales bacterium]
MSDPRPPAQDPRTEAQRLLKQLEALLPLMEHPETLEDDLLENLPLVWQQAVDDLEQLDREGLLIKEDPALRSRLEAVLQRLPTALEAVRALQSDIAQQLFSENRRMKSLRAYGSGLNPEQLLHRKV